MHSMNLFVGKSEEVLQSIGKHKFVFGFVFSDLLENSGKSKGDTYIRKVNDLKCR